ncbi:MAG TPA: TatD family hydrolase [Phycisphaerae bacterium]|nr:TatD family hydrolase [Phycisphaerae bacterium]
MSDPTLIDTHCHLTFPQLHDTVTDILERARQAHVSTVITVGTDLNDSQKCIDLAGRHARVFCTVGIHPHQAASAPPDAAQRLANLIKHPHVVAVGETGLDYHYDFSPPKTQQAILHEQLALAEQTQLPVVIHCREAFDDALTILAEHPRVPGAVFHCFTGSHEQAKAVLERGCMLSMTGVVTFARSDELRTVASNVPDDRLMVETDSPYLSPEPVRKQRTNEPANVVHTARLLAKVRGQSFADLARVTTANARTFFKLDTAAQTT